MCWEEIDLHLKLYGMNAGDEASLSPYLRHLMGKHLPENIRDRIITGQVCSTEYYDGHHVPLPATLLKNIKTRKYI